MYLSALIVTALISVLVTDIYGDASITLEATPSTIHPVLTKKLQLRCAVKSDEWRLVNKRKDSTNSLLSTTRLYAVTEKPVSMTTNPPSSPTQASVLVTSSDAPLSRLLSIVVAKLNDVTGVVETVTSVTGCDIPVTEDKFRSTVQVEGNSQGSTVDVEMGYLLLTWDRPVDRHAGNFTCEAYGLKSDKRPASLKASLEIPAVEPKIVDLVDYISVNEKAITSVKEQLSKVTEENEILRQEIATLSANATKWEESLSGIKGQNIQTGTFSCTSLQKIQFSVPFKKPPIVSVFVNNLSLSRLDIYTNRGYVDLSASYSVTLQSVETTSFTYTCTANYLVPTFTWLAIDN